MTTPVLVNNSLTVTNNGTTVLTSTNLKATDVDSNDALLLFTTSNTQHGGFSFASEPATVINTFYQQNITDAQVQFSHDGGVIAPSFNVAVSDGVFSTAPVPASISFTSINDAPVLVNHQLTLNEEDAVILNSDNLSASDVDNPDSSLRFILSEITQGFFDFVSAQGVSITQFYQQNVTDSQVRFTHNGSEIAPSYNATVTDGELSSASQAANVTLISVNDAPVFSNNTLTIAEGERRIITSSDIAATDPDNTEDDFMFTVSGVEHGQFEPTETPGFSLSQFTSANVTASQVQFAHDSSDFAPSYNVTVSDGELSTIPTPAVITFNNNVNDVPVLINNSLTIANNGTAILTNNDLSATDPDHDDAGLKFTTSGIQHGDFSFASDPGAVIVDFYQQNITDAQVQFTHDGSFVTPTYQVSVEDGVLNASAVVADISFTGGSLSPTGHEFLINTNTTNNQYKPRILGLDNGGFAATWSSWGGNSPGSEWDIHGQIFDENLEKSGNEILVNTHTPKDQNNGDITRLDNGDIAAVWTSYLQDGSGSGIFGQLLSSSGTKVGQEFQVNEFTDSTQATPAIVSMYNNTFLTTWSSFGNDGHNYGIFAQQFDSGTNEIGAEFQINTNTTSAQQYPSVARLANEDVVIAWQDSALDGNGEGVYAQLLDKSLTPVGEQFQLHSDIIDSQNRPSIAGLKNGNFVAVWQSFAEDGSDYGVFGQLFANDKAKIGSAFQVNTYTNQAQYEPRAIGLSDGNFIVVWSSQVQDGSLEGIYAQRFDSSANKIDSEFQVNVSTSDVQSQPDIAELTNRNILVVWENHQGVDGFDIYGRQFGFNIAPTLVNNILVMNEGDSVILNGTNLSATDFNGSEGNLIFNISSIVNGQFAFLSDIGTAITSFFQQNVTDSQVQFTHDGSELAPGFDVSVSDGELSTIPTPAVITFNNNVNDAPVLINNSLTITNNGTAVLTSNDLSATDPDNDNAGLKFATSGTKHGDFRFASDPATVINTFYQQNITDSQVQFKHDGSFVTPAYGVWVSDGELTSLPVSALTTLKGAAVPIGGEFQVNTYTTSDQQKPSVTSLTNGRFVIVWESDGRYAAADEISGQLYDSAGTPIGTEFVVNTYAINQQDKPSVIGLANGGFGVTWESLGQDGSSAGIYAQVFDGDAQRIGIEFQVNTYTQAGQYRPDIASLANGNLAVVWQDIQQEDASYGVYGQRFNSLGNKVGSEFHVNTLTTGPQYHPTVSGLSDGKFVVAWSGDITASGSDYEIYAQLFNADGSLFGSEFQINTYITDEQIYPSVTGLSNGNFVATWRSRLQDGDVYGVYGQTYHADGSRYKEEFQVNTYTMLGQEAPSVTEIENGMFVITWTSDGQDCDFTCGFDVYGQVFDANNNLYGGEFLVNTHTQSHQHFSSVSGLSNDQFVVAWESSNGQDGDGYGIYGQLFDLNTSPILVDNTLAVNEGESVTINETNFSAMDVNGSEGNLIFKISSIINGQFAFSSDVGTAITSFFQQNVTDSQVQFTHDGSELAPGFDVRVSDGELSTIPTPAVITFNNNVNDAPVLINNSLTITNNGTAILTSNDLSASDVDNNDADLQFTASNNQHGIFTFVSDPATAINNFYQQNVTDAQVQFAHDDSGVLPGYNVSVNDGDLVSTTAPADVNLISYVFGDVFQVNTYTVNSQREPSVATLSNGNFVVVWTSQAQDNGTDGIYGQLYSQKATRIGGEFQVNTSSEQAREPAVADLSNDEFIVAWAGVGLSTLDIWGQRYNATADPIGGEFRLNQYTTDRQEQPTIIGLNDGGFLLAWKSKEQAGYPNKSSIYGRRYNSVGIGNDEFLIGPDAGVSQAEPKAALLGGGAYVVVWSEDSDIYANHYQANGTLENEHFKVNTRDFIEFHPAVSRLEGDGFVASWSSAIAADTGLYTQRFNTFGNPVGAELQVAPATIPGKYSSITNLNDGNYVVVWNDNIVGVGEGALMQQFNMTGEPVTPISQLNNVPHTIAVPKVATLTNNKFITVWESSNQDGDGLGIFGRVGGRNVVPDLVSASLAINQGEAVILANTDLSATDNGGSIADLMFKVSSIQQGQFEQTSNTTFPITQFTQQQVIDSNIQFVHNGTPNAPSFDVAVNDGVLETIPAPATIDFNLAPVLGNHTITMGEGEMLVLDGINFSATDVETDDAGLTFIFSDIQKGIFELIGGGSIVNATQAQISAGDVSFIHDGSEIAPSLGVSVNDGRMSTNPIPATIDFTGSNDVPVLLQNQLSIDEGETIILNSTNLSAADTDNDDATLHFDIGALQHGQFGWADTNTTITDFYQQNITDSQVHFTHDGSEIGPSYNVTVSDNNLNTTPSAADINFIQVNDSPVLLTNQLTINEGETVILSGINLNATDADDVNTGLQFDISSLEHGQFSWAGTNTTMTDFYQQNITDSQVQFTHDGSEIAPSYQVSVSDSDIATTPTTVSTTFSANDNDGPILNRYQLAVNEGERVTLTRDDFLVTDVDHDDTVIEFFVSSVQQGQFELSINQNVAITQFKQQQINDGVVQFVHDGGEVAPSFIVVANDSIQSTAEQAGQITFNANVNDAPVLLNNQLTMHEGEVVVLGDANLFATDEDDEDSTLTFIFDGIQQGSFELVSGGTLVSNATQAQITAGEVQFMHDGGELAPSLGVSVSDGENNIGSFPLTVNFTNMNDAPSLINNSLTVLNGDTSTLSSTDLSATDVDNLDGGLKFSISNVLQGIFDYFSKPGVAISEFYQQNITDSQVRFVHAGNKLVPSFDVSVSDGELSTTPTSTDITFTNTNEAPILGNNELTINEGETVTLSDINLSATDVDGDPMGLKFNITDIQHGQFGWLGTNNTVTNFSQQNITDAQIQFTHDGAEVMPRYQVSVSDGVASTSSVPAQISFTRVNDAPLLESANMTITEGETIIFSSSELRASDSDNSDGTLRFNVHNVQQGMFSFITDTATTVTDFFQQNITASMVQFSHDGGELPPSFDVSVSDGLLTTSSVSVPVSFTHVNDAPMLLNNELTLPNNGIVILSSNNISATDVDSPDNDLEFVIGNVQEGHFDYVNMPGVAITNFHQQNITDGQVRFVHAGQGMAPYFDTQVTDGELGTTPQIATVSFTDVNMPPQLATNQLTLDEGETIIISVGHLRATDVDNPDQGLMFGATDVMHGDFEWIDTKTHISAFSQKNVTDSQVQFTHDGSEIAPSYLMRVSDGESSSAAFPGVITFTNVNDRPEVMHTPNDKTVIVGKPFNITLSKDTFSDPEGEQLSYSASLKDGRAIPSEEIVFRNEVDIGFHGELTRARSLNLKVTAEDPWGTQADVSFLLNGLPEETAPANDNALTSESGSSSSPTQGSFWSDNALPIGLGGVATVGFLLAGLGLFARKRKQKSDLAGQEYLAETFTPDEGGGAQELGSMQLPGENAWGEGASPFFSQDESTFIESVEEEPTLELPTVLIGTAEAQSDEDTVSTNGMCLSRNPV